MNTSFVPRKPAARRKSRRTLGPILAFAIATVFLFSLVGAAVFVALGDGRAPGIEPTGMPRPAQPKFDVAEFAPADPTKLKQVSAETAEAINAALPVSMAPNPAARSFAVPPKDIMALARSLDCMTAAIYYEAATEPLDGQRAVAQVILNRVRHPLYPHSVCDVIYQGVGHGRSCQFSFACDGSISRRPDPAGWRRAHLVALTALTGSVYAPVGWATHYHADYVVPVWAPTLVKTSVIGRHIFYRLAGGLGQANSFSARYAGLEPDAPAIAAALGQAVSPDLSSTSEPVPPAARPVLLPSGSPVDGGAQATPSAPSPSGRWVVPSQGIDVNNTAPAR